MIVPMKKVTLLMRDRYRDEALTRLRDFGVMHIEMSKAPSEKLAEIAERKARTEKAIALFKSGKKKAAPAQKAPPQGWTRRSSDRSGTRSRSRIPRTR